MVRALMKRILLSLGNGILLLVVIVVILILSESALGDLGTAQSITVRPWPRALILDMAL
jgi:hypothetical protein